MLAFALTLVRPHWKPLLLVILPMLVETAMTLASPWPLKIVLDSVFEPQPSPPWLIRLAPFSDDRLAILKRSPGRDPRDRSASGCQRLP